ncbi:isopalmitoylresorcinol synthase [Marihabitans asiaticum]|uniref:Isopalmitoylresorcinol synthase n=2 Tax=Marihabitans asiaticum TaxID=415218 RepID=A0A560W6L1_9MICO|nr:isopalmitoylresorcinol synthase [Marihabitans asiaticum]
MMSQPGATSSRTSTLCTVGTALPPHRYEQAELSEMFLELIGDTGLNPEVVRRVHGNAGVSTRHLALPAEQYLALRTFGEANDAFIDAAVDLGSRALLDALAQAGLAPKDVDLVASATVTGIAVPSLDARIAAQVGLRQDVRRVPLVGLGCVAGAAGIARVHDYLLGHPEHVAVLVAIELCSLTVQRDDPSMANVVASGLFGDGAAAVVLTGARHPGAEGRSAEVVVRDSRSRMYAGTERAMGWDVGHTGLRIVLGAEVPRLVETHLRDDVDGFLAEHGLTRDDIGWWVAHPGGPKVLEAMQAALEVPRAALGLTWTSLDRIGNLSSASVLHVLADTLRERPPAPGTHGMLLAMGPGFCLEMVLLHSGDPR